MNSDDYSAPPSFSSRDSRSIDRQFSAKNQTSVAGEYATQAPSFSSTGNGIAVDGQRTLPGEYYVQAPSYTAFQHGTGNSATQFTDGYGYRGSVQTDDGSHADAPGLDATLHENNSAANGFNSYYGYEQPPSYSAADPRYGSNLEVSAAESTPMVNIEENLGISLTGRKFRGAKLKAFYTDKDIY